MADPPDIHKGIGNENMEEIEKGDTLDYGDGTLYDVTKSESLAEPAPDNMEDGVEYRDDDMDEK